MPLSDSPQLSESPLSTYTPSSSSSSNTENQFESSQFSSSPSSSTTPIFLAAVIPLPTFRGLPSECPISHLTLFNRLFPSNNPSSLTRTFPLTLLDDAALWYQISVVDSHPSMSWDQTKSAFLRAFRPPQYADTARTELVSLRQREGESVTSYHLRMQWILKRWPENGLPESLVRGLFVDGLREEFHDWVMQRKPETIQEALRVAMDWEGASTVRRGGEVMCGFCEGMHGEKDCEVRRRMRRRRGREEESKVERVVSIASVGRRSSSQCQCSKHQCWKKYERSGSAVDMTNVNGDNTASAPVGAASFIIKS